MYGFYRHANLEQFTNGTNKQNTSIMYGIYRRANLEQYPNGTKKQDAFKSLRQ